MCLKRDVGDIMEILANGVVASALLAKISEVIIPGRNLLEAQY